MKKFILGMGSVAAVAAPIVGTVSCGDDSSQTTEKVDVLMLRDYSPQSTKFTAFTQGIYDAAKAEATRLGISFGTRQVSANTPDGREKTIRNAIELGGVKTFILASFSFSTELEALAKKYPQAKFIAVDSKDANTQSNVANVWADSNQIAFLGGYYLGKWVDTELKAHHGNKFKFHPNATAGDNGTHKVTVGYSGGYAFETVTRFYDGLRAGVEYWNKHNNATTDFDLDFMYSTNVGTDGWDDHAYANAWAPSSEGQKAVFQRMVDAQSDIMIGNGNLAAYNEAITTGAKVWDIYPDSDVNVSNPAQAPFTALSLIKNVGAGVANILKRQYHDKTNTDYTAPFNAAHAGLDATGLLDLVGTPNGLPTSLITEYKTDRANSASVLMAKAKNAWYRQSGTTWTNYLASL